MPLAYLGRTRSFSGRACLLWSETPDIISVSGPEQDFRAGVLIDPGRWQQAGTTPLTSLPTTALNDFIAFEISLVAEVEAVFTAYRNEVFYVWVIVNRFEKDVRERIYDRQRAIIDELPGFEFDFYVIASLGRDPWELVSESVTLAFQRRS